MDIAAWIPLTEEHKAAADCTLNGVSYAAGYASSVLQEAVVTLRSKLLLPYV
jgi:hypothetical protein